MDSSRTTKRPRTSVGGSYRDTVPLAGDERFDIIHASEGKLRRVGNHVRTAAFERYPQRATDAWEAITQWEPEDDPSFALDPDGKAYEKVVEEDVMAKEPPKVKPKPKKSRVSRRPHVVWMETSRQQYLDEILRWAGRADFRSASACPDCISRKAPVPQAAEYRCEECFLADLVCAGCCVRRHRMHPFHWIQHWSGSSFTRVSLKSLGLKIQLNHGSLYCENPIACHVSMQVLHTNGIHTVDIQYCGCTRTIPFHIQLLRRRLYPASQKNVKMCATFTLLELLHKLAWTTKGSTYDFYRCLERLTDNSGSNVPKSRYRVLSRMVLQWRHLAMLKWAGRGLVADGAASTQPGELAVKCPSCPHPGINLVEGWESAPKELRFLYMMILCMDANFRLKNQLVSNYSQDPGLGIGMAYMVPRKGYEAYVLSWANDDDISTCVGFQALAKANTKFSVGLRYTGVNTIVCGRSEMIMPCGVGNLQKGERYANMDYIFGTVLQAIYVALVLISYDIACQWFINLQKRIEEHWPQEIKPRADVQLIPAIPKLHEPMHQSVNHEVYSLNLIHGVGHSDCECCERVWSPHNAIGNSTKTQGPGSRQDVLDDHFGFWNWMKYVSLGSSLLRRYRAAVAERNVQREGHRGLSDSLGQETLRRWEAMCEEWENDTFPKSKENPYLSDGTTLSEVQVKKELEEEESKRSKAGEVALHATSALGFLLLGLDLEDTQRRLRRLAQSTDGSPVSRKEGTLAEQRTGMLAQLQGWEQILPIYAPGLLQYKSTLASQSAATSSASEKVEDTIIWMPSQIPKDKRSAVWVKGLPEMEQKLRTAQCSDSLDSLCRILKIKSRMILFKNKNIRGQRSGTRSRAVIDRVHERARASAGKYRAARSARLALEGPGDWEKTHRVLEDADIRGFQDPDRLRPRVGRKGTREDDNVDMEAGPAEEVEFTLFNEIRTRRDGTGETRRTLSWIWTAGSGDRSKDEAAKRMKGGKSKGNTDAHGSKPVENEAVDSIEGSTDVQGEQRTNPAKGKKKADSGGKKLEEKKLEDDDDIFRSEWARSRARVERAKEEVMLVKEEMARTLRYLEWRAGWWMENSRKRDDISPELSEGLQAYAARQSSIQNSLASKFRELWRDPLTTEETTGDNSDEEENEEENEDVGDDEDGGDGKGSGNDDDDVHDAMDP